MPGESEGNMTREELIEMTGDEEQADFAMRIVLKQITESFVIDVVRAELKEINEKIRRLVKDGYIYECNGSLHVSGDPDQDRKKQNEAECLLYTRNRTVSLICVR